MGEETEMSVKQMLGVIEGKIADAYSDSLFEIGDNKTLANNVGDTVKMYLDQLRESKILLDYPEAKCSNAVRCVVRQLRHRPVVGFVLNEGDVVLCKRKFYGRRKARVFARYGWKGVVFVDIKIRPAQPIERITGDIKVNNAGECSVR